MKKIILLSVLYTLCANMLHADEGMWLISVLTGQNAAQMQAEGLHLSPDQIYSVNHTSMKDAIVNFSGFCSGTIVSDHGLIFTNHHCGYETIANASTPAHNYLDNGFWAASYTDEIPAPGLYARLLVRIEDVTDSLVPYIGNLDGAARAAKAGAIYKRLTKNATAGTDYTAEVKPIYYGNQYIMCIYETYNDVRLVGAPPQSLGKFGGDTDNWMWPRHTCDFSIFRVYASKDNKPAGYNKDNIAYKPRNYIPVSLKGVKEGDYTMILGYPGTTNRYLTSYGVQEVVDVDNPNNIRVFKVVTDAMKVQMDKSVAIRLEYSGTYAKLMNSLKLWQGQLEGIKHEQAVDIKQTDEARFMTWLKQQPDSIQKKYSGLLDKIKDEYTALKPTGRDLAYVGYGLLRQDIISTLQEMDELHKALNDKKTTPDTLQAMSKRLKPAVRKYFSTTDYATERYILLATLKQAYTDYPATAQPVFLKAIENKYTKNGVIDWDKYTKDMDSYSLLADTTRMMNFLAHPTAKVANKDPLWALSDSLQSALATLRPIIVTHRTNINTLQRGYVKAMMSMPSKRVFYPDANFTMRLTYGTVEPCIPRDGIEYTDQTTIEGVLAKYVPGDAEFNVPDEVLKAAHNKDFGQYGANGTLPVCFLSTNDITGGNSGSGVFNANGEMVGLAFDGNYEGTAEEFVFSKTLNRTINVDIRYVLWVVDKVYHADRIRDELKLVQ